MEKKVSIYQTEKRVFILSADAEQRGLNATLKAINAVASLPESVRTFAADGIKKDVFKTASGYVDYLRANLPIVFNSDNALCAVKVVEDNDNNREIYAGYQIEPVSVNDCAMLRVWIPKSKFTCSEVYNLAKKAANGIRRAEKAAAAAAKKAANEEKKAARTAAKIEKLQKQLAELQK